MRSHPSTARKVASASRTPAGRFSLEGLAASVPFRKARLSTLEPSGGLDMKIVTALGTSALQMRVGRAGGRKAKTSVQHEGVSARNAGTPPCLVPSPPCSA